MPGCGRPDQLSLITARSVHACAGHREGARRARVTLGRRPEVTRAPGRALSCSRGWPPRPRTAARRSPRPTPRAGTGGRRRGRDGPSRPRSPAPQPRRRLSRRCPLAHLEGGGLLHEPDQARLRRQPGEVRRAAEGRGHAESFQHRAHVAGRPVDPQAYLGQGHQGAAGSPPARSAAVIAARSWATGRAQPAAPAGGSSAVIVSLPPWYGSDTACQPPDAA